MARTTYKLVRDDGNGHRSEVMFETDNLAEIARFADEKSGFGFDLGLDGGDELL